MKIINNTTEKLADDLRVTIKKRSRVSMAAACFSVYAFEELKAQLENKSTEKTYMFSVESASINGVQCDPMFASEVAAGKKANEEINFSTDTLEENGIVEFK